MRIAINTKPLETGYRIQGTGTYIRQLLNGLRNYYPQHDYVEFSKADLPKNVDLVHYPFFNPFFLTLPLRKKLPTVVTVHDLIPLVFPQHFPVGLKGMVKWKIQQRSLQGAAAIISDSESSKNDIVRIAKIDQGKVHVIYLAAGEEFKVQSSKFKVQSLLKKYNLPDKFVLYVGDILWSKNIPNLIQAIKKVNVTLVMVGKQTKAIDFDKSHPWNKDLVLFNYLVRFDKRIIRLGFVPEEDLVAIYNSATLLIQPSFYEGFGLPVLEAMACGCPVVTTRGGSLPEVAGEAAVYVDPYNVPSITDGISEVYFNDRLQKQLIEKGTKQAKKFSWRKTAQQTVEVYEKVL